MIFTWAARIFALALAIGWYFDLKEETVKRSKLTPNERRLQRIYAKRRKQKWQPRGRVKIPKRIGRVDLDAAQKDLRFGK